MRGVFCFILSACMVISGTSSQLASGFGDGFHSKLANKGGHISKFVDRSIGVYMHDHPDFVNKVGAPGRSYHTQYLHGNKRSLLIEKFVQRFTANKINPRKQKSVTRPSWSYKTGDSI